MWAPNRLQAPPIACMAVRSALPDWAKSALASAILRRPEPVLSVHAYIHQHLQ
tara:strand:+ start:56768 stop:56926 length:159 start_codon:yes stop_codon:yes gene_type:complete